MTEEQTSSTESGELSPQEIQQLAGLLSQSQSSVVPEEKFNVHTFLHKVASEDDTTKVGYLEPIEIGTPVHTVRSLKGFALIADKIIENPLLKEYFEAQSEIVTSTSLSKEGFLVRQATTQTRNVADVTKRYKPNKSWFKKKEDNNSEKSE